ncbi:hypothetical protein Pint_33503 [Pistacia integerrima]|uniref:Uncharacterized protein n=1 Tax=Pistacia integerrima TaxID=434235 RepID=A0ACC0X774_9ROSI|nr:hypothetical protein Pint_33503 [Pistacia integerrima]
MPLPTALHEILPGVTLKLSREETEEVLFTVMKDLLSRHKINLKSIDILVSNCSLFCPTPISSIIINNFGLRSNIKNFSLSGMGCSAGMLSISLVKDLLKVHTNSLALVLSIEAVAPDGYRGCTKSMLIANTIFRMGGAAILLSNRHKDKHIAKSACITILQAASIWVVSDSPENLVYLEKRNLMCQISEKLLSTSARGGLRGLVHAGGRTIIQAVEDNLRLHKEDGEASKMTLHRFGNTSSASVWLLWYELCYLEAKGKMKKGDRVQQTAFRSGFKTNSAVWKCISDLNPDVRNAWSARIHFYPVNIHNIL